MRPTTLAPATVAFCLVAAAPVAAWPNDASLPLDVAVIRLSANSDLSATAEAPAVVSMGDTELVAMRYAPEAIIPLGEVAAGYDRAGRTISLTGEHSRTPAEHPVRMHERVFPAQGAIDPPAEGATSIEELKAAYLRCELAALRSVLSGEEAMACSVIYEELKRVGFDGDAGRLREWSAPFLGIPRLREAGEV